MTDDMHISIKRAKMDFSDCGGSFLHKLTSHKYISPEK